MTHCDEYQALISPWLDGALPEEEADALREHLAVCPDCQRYYDDVMAIRDDFPSVEETAVPEGFADGVMAAVRADKAAHRRRRRRSLLPVAACAAVVVLLGSGGYLSGMFYGGGSSGSAAPAMARSEDTAATAGAAGGACLPESDVVEPESAPAQPEEDRHVFYTAGEKEPAQAPGEAKSAEPVGSGDNGAGETGAAAQGDGAPAEAVSGGTAPAGQMATLTAAPTARLILTGSQAGDALADYDLADYDDGTVTGQAAELTAEEYDALLAALPGEVAAEAPAVTEGETVLVIVTP